MMQMRRALLLAVLAGAVAAPAAPGRETIEWQIAKQPVYQSKPEYALLVFGPDARTRVWMVQDGDLLYVDHNGNGDLTEPSKRLERSPGRADPQSPGGWDPSMVRVHEIADATHANRYTDLRVTWGDVDGRRGYEVAVTINGRYHQTWMGKFAERLADAPIIHFHGPLSLFFEAGRSATVLLRTKNDCQFYARVETPCANGECVNIDHARGGLDNQNPVAVIDFPNKTPGEPPVRKRVSLDHRC